MNFKYFKEKNDKNMDYEFINEGLCLDYGKINYLS